MDEVKNANTTDVRFSSPMVLLYVYIAIVMVMGLLGNLLVAVVYVTKFKATTTTCLIIAMTIADLLSCAVVMPLDLGAFLTSSITVWKVQQCSTALTYIFSGYLTLVVAADRYRRICNPFASQLSVQGAKGAIIGCFLIAVAFSCLRFPVSEEQQSDIPGPNETRTQCDLVETLYGIPFDVIYYMAVSLQFIVGAVALVVLYSIIGCKMLKLQRLYGYSPARQSTNDAPDQPLELFSQGDPTPEDDLDGDVNIMEEGMSQRSDAEFRKMTCTLFLVTLIYLLSFLPCIVLSGHFVADGMNGVGLAVIEMFYRMLYFSSASNPILYLVRHDEFRTECRQLLMSPK